MRTWKRRSQAKETAPAAVQLRGGERHPFALLDGYVPLHEPAFGLYRAIREAVPVVDAAVLKLVRLAGGVHVTCAVIAVKTWSLSKDLASKMSPGKPFNFQGPKLYGISEYQTCHLRPLNSQVAR